MSNVVVCRPGVSFMGSASTSLENRKKALTEVAEPVEASKGARKRFNALLQ